jgi:hypothetical protein
LTSFSGIMKNADKATIKVGKREKRSVGFILKIQGY